MNHDQENNQFLLYDVINNVPRPPRILGLTSKMVLYYHNPIIGQFNTLRLRKRHPYPTRNASILITKYRKTLKYYYNSKERITNPNGYRITINIYQDNIKLLERDLKKKLSNCVA